MDAKSRQSRAANLALAIGSLIFAIFLLLVAEGAVRLFSDQHFLGYSRKLFIPHAFGASRGNAQSVEAIAFGGKVFTDANGFRVPRSSLGKPASEDDGRPEIVLLGDSVGFGSGVPEEETMAGLLRNALPRWNVINASVVGYSTNDYKNVFDHFVADRQSIDHIFLIFCMNDVSDYSSVNIRASLTEQEVAKGTDNDQNQPRIPIIDDLKQFSWALNINSYLRPRSKLFVWLKNRLIDLDQREKVYTERFRSPDENVYPSLQPLKYIADQARAKNLRFTVVISPFVSHVAKPISDNVFPQEVLKHYFIENDIDFIDALSVMEPEHAETYFLTDDIMHLSSAGHHAIYRLMLSELSPQARSGSQTSRHW